MDMDFTIPLSSSQNFTDLLSQQEINTPNINTPNIFSQPQSPLPETSKDAVAKHRWTVPEEKILICAWLHTSKDAIVGNEQRGGKFWERVALFYASSRTVAGLPKREPNTCKQKWCKINESVSKFSGCMEAAERVKKSGQNDDDVIQFAYQLYFQDQKMKFNLEHAWRLLRNDQKWRSLRSARSSSSKRTKLSESSNFSSNSVTGLPEEEETEERPMGVKGSKAKGKKRRQSEESESGSVKLLGELWVIKEKEVAATDKHDDKKLLESLISKKEPLTEMEVALKQKLILQML